MSALNTVALPPASKDLEININTPTIRELADAIRSLKNGMVIDQRIREEQVGFRAGRGYSNQIFSLRNMVEQCAPLFVNFVDRKACPSRYSVGLNEALRFISEDRLENELLEYGVILK